MKTLRADYTVATELMDSLYTMYMAAVKSFGGDPNNPEAREEGANYARNKFCELAEEFEKLYGPWAWVTRKDKDNDIYPD